MLDFIAKKNGLTMFDCSDRDPESTYELTFLWTFSFLILLLAFNWVGIKRDSSFFFHLFAIQVIHVSFCLKSDV